MLVLEAATDLHDHLYSGHCKERQGLRDQLAELDGLDVLVIQELGRFGLDVDQLTHVIDEV